MPNCRAGDDAHVSVQLDTEKPDGTVLSAHKVFESSGASIFSLGDIEARPLSTKAAPAVAVASASTQSMRATLARQVSHALIISSPLKHSHKALAAELGR